MTWPARTWVAGERVTATLGNNYWRDPINDIRSGAVSMSSQAANDFPFPSAASQWTRIAAVSGCVPRFTGATWEMKNPIGEIAWPVGSVYESILSTNPNSLLGFGTWVAFGTGRVTVGIDAGDLDFDTVEETGGAKTHTLVVGEIPAHSHTQDAHTHVQNAHTHVQDAHGHTQDAHGHTQNSHNHTQNAHNHSFSNMGTNVGTDQNSPTDAAAPSGTENTDLVTAVNNATTATNQNTTATNQVATAVNSAATAVNNAATATNQNTGGGAAHTNLQPYVVIYRWKRTA